MLAAATIKKQMSSTGIKSGKKLSQTQSTMEMRDTKQTERMNKRYIQQYEITVNAPKSMQPMMHKMARPFHVKRKPDIGFLTGGLTTQQSPVMTLRSNQNLTISGHQQNHSIGFMNNRVNLIRQIVTNKKSENLI